MIRRGAERSALLAISNVFQIRMQISSLRPKKSGFALIDLPTTGNRDVLIVSVSEKKQVCAHL